MNNLIGLTGKAGVGKTTIAQGFKSIYGYEIESYASPLKAALAILTGKSLHNFTITECKEKPLLPNGMTPRQLMQMMGTEFVREMIDEDFWIWNMEARIKDTLHTGGRIVIDDIRFENEAQLVRDLGGKVVHLERDYEPVTERSSHRSEQFLNTAGDIAIECGIMSPESVLNCIVGCLQ